MTKSKLRYKGRLYVRAAKLPMTTARLVEIIEKGILRLNTENDNSKHNITPNEAKARARNIAHVILSEIEAKD